MFSSEPDHASKHQESEGSVGWIASVCVLGPALNKELRSGRLDKG